MIERIKTGEIVHFPVTRYNAHDSVPDVPDAPVWIRTIVFPIYDSSGKPENFIFMHENITQSKEAEEALRESEARAQALMKAIPDMLFRVNRQGVFLDYKADIKDLYAQSEPNLIGKSCRDVLPPEFVDLIDLKIHAVQGVDQVFT